MYDFFLSRSEALNRADSLLLKLGHRKVIGVTNSSPSPFLQIENKTFNKRTNRALLSLRRSQKHYEIFSNNVFRKNITRKQLILETIEIA